MQALQRTTLHHMCGVFIGPSKKDAPEQILTSSKWTTFEAAPQKQKCTALFVYALGWLPYQENIWCYFQIFTGPTKPTQSSKHSIMGHTFEGWGISIQQCSVARGEMAVSRAGMSFKHRFQLHKNQKCWKWLFSPSEKSVSPSVDYLSCFLSVRSALCC